MGGRRWQFRRRVANGAQVVVQVQAMDRVRFWIAAGIAEAVKRALLESTACVTFWEYQRCRVPKLNSGVTAISVPADLPAVCL